MEFSPMFNVYIKTDNAAFGERSDTRNEEVARILHVIATHLEMGADEGKALDLNGNSVGHWGFADE